MAYTQQIKFCVGSLTATQVQKIQDGIGMYNEIMREFSKPMPLDKNVDFQRLFNKFYRVRRNQQWRDSFYDIFQRNRGNQKVEFNDLYKEVSKAVKRQEKSFVSKMLHTINDSSPIIDRNVLRGLEIKANDPVVIYDELKSRYKDVLIPTATKTGFFSDFDAKFSSGATISAVKKIDFYLWAYFA